MSRALSDIIKAYTNMDIENLDGPEISAAQKGLLSRTKPTMKSSVDNTSPVYYIGQQMKVVRKYRDEIKNNGT